MEKMDNFSYARISYPGRAIRFYLNNEAAMNYYTINFIEILVNMLGRNGNNQMIDLFFTPFDSLVYQFIPIAH